MDSKDIVKVHEAGHAVMRVLTARDWGYAPEEAVDHIAMRRRALRLDKTAASSATTYGPMFSRALDVPMRSLGTQPGNAELAAALARCREQGLDVDGWLAIKLMIILAGPVAEARWIEQDVNFFLETADCAEFDLREAVASCHWVGRGHECEQLIEHATARSTSMFQQPGAWQAVRSLAAALPDHGKMSGAQVARLVRANVKLDSIHP